MWACESRLSLFFVCVLNGYFYCHHLFAPESQKNQLSNSGGRKENSNPKKKILKFVDTSSCKSSCEGFGAGGKWRNNSFGRDLQANDPAMRKDWNIGRHERMYCRSCCCQCGSSCNAQAQVTMIWPCGYNRHNTVPSRLDNGQRGYIPLQISPCLPFLHFRLIQWHVLDDCFTTI